MPGMGEAHPRWKGGRSLDKSGRVMISLNGRKVYEYVLVAEQALGKLLPPKAIIHHVDGNNTNNINSNLVICEDQAYHMLLHQRMRVLEVGGNPNTQYLCGRCNKAKDFSVFYRQKVGRAAGRPTSYCKVCISELDSLRTEKRRKEKHNGLYI